MLTNFRLRTVNICSLETVLYLHFRVERESLNKTTLAREMTGQTPVIDSAVVTTGDLESFGKGTSSSYQPVKLDDDSQDKMSPLVMATATEVV